MAEISKLDLNDVDGDGQSRAVRVVPPVQAAYATRAILVPTAIRAALATAGAGALAWAFVQILRTIVD